MWFPERELRKCLAEASRLEPVRACEGLGGSGSGHTRWVRPAEMLGGACSGMWARSYQDPG
jgi:hypothetical protein